MPRKRNEETTARVLEATWRLFGEKGYNATSYADVSRASGVNRATVQHYFPKKELMASMHLNLLRSACTELVEAHWPEVKNSIAEQYLVGQVYVSALLAGERERRFTLDVLESRAFTDETISTDLEWSLEQVFGVGKDHADAETRQDVLAAMGGLYGLMYHAACTGEPFDLAKRLQPGLASLGRLAGNSEESCREAFARYALSQEELDRLAEAAKARAFALIAEHPWEKAE